MPVFGVRTSRSRRLCDIWVPADGYQPCARGCSHRCWSDCPRILPRVSQYSWSLHPHWNARQNQRLKRMLMFAPTL